MYALKIRIEDKMKWMILCGKDCRGNLSISVHSEYKNRLRVLYKNSILFKPTAIRGGAVPKE